MRRRTHFRDDDGHSLVETLLVLAVLAVCLTAGVTSLATGLRMLDARGAAQVWQAAAAWGQVGAVWQGGVAGVSCSPGELSVVDDSGRYGGDLGASAPAAPVSANLLRWRRGEGVLVRFLGGFAAPDGGGSLYFGAASGGYRVVVRPESGLTARSRVRVIP
jgi:hypothetical protein